MAVFEEQIIGIDLGTANTLINIKNKGIVLREPTVVTYEMNTGRTLAYGSEAKENEGKTHYGICNIHPIKEGVVADYELTCTLLHNFLKKTHLSAFARPKVVASIPEEVTEIERNALADVLFDAGASSVSLIETSVAAAIGAGTQAKSPHGFFIADIGAGTTEIAVLSSGEIVASHSLRTAGNTFDRSITKAIRRKFNVLVGDAGAEDLKIAAASAHYATDKGLFEAKGQNLSSGLGAVFSVYSSEIREAITQDLAAIADGIHCVLEDLTPELSADLYDTGITLAGGGALIPGIDLYMEETLKLPCHIAKKPLDCVIDGIAKVMENPSMEALLEQVKKG